MHNQSNPVRKTANSLRGAIDEAEAMVIFLLFIVNVKTACDLTEEVLVDFAGVVHDLDLPHSRDSQQHVLIVDKGLVSGVHGLVIVPFSPVEAVQ